MSGLLVRWDASTGIPFSTSSPAACYSPKVELLMTVLNSACLFQFIAFRCDALQQIVPGFIERLGPFPLELNRKVVVIDARPTEAVQHLLTVPAIGRQQVSDLAVIGECP